MPFSVAARVNEAWLRGSGRELAACRTYLAECRPGFESGACASAGQARIALVVIVRCLRDHVRSNPALGGRSDDDLSRARTVDVIRRCRCLSADDATASICPLSDLPASPWRLEVADHARPASTMVALTRAPERDDGGRRAQSSRRWSSSYPDGRARGDRVPKSPHECDVVDRAVLPVKHAAPWRRVRARAARCHPVRRAMQARRVDSGDATDEFTWLSSVDNSINPVIIARPGSYSRRCSTKAGYRARLVSKNSRTAPDKLPIDGASNPAAAPEAAPGSVAPNTLQRTPARPNSYAIDKPITPSPIIITSAR